MNKSVLRVVLTGVLAFTTVQFGVVTCGEEQLFPYRNPYIGVIPVSVGNGSKDSVIRIWEESVEPRGTSSREEKEECLVIGRGIGCGDLDCRDHLAGSRGVARICKYGEFRPDNKKIPSFIDEDLPTCRIFDLRDVSGVGDILSEGLFSSPRACLCSEEGRSGTFRVLSPSVSADDRGGWRLEVFRNELEVPKIHPFNRFIVDVRVMVNPGWNLEFTLSSSLQLRKAALSVVSLKKDRLCQGFPEDESLQILQPVSLESKGSQVLQTYSWNPNKSGDGLFDYKFPANQQTTTHYYICHYHHHNSNSGHLIGNIYFRLNPEDAIQTFSVILLVIIFTPLALFVIYIVISSKHKTSIDKLQGYILLENRSQVSQS